MSDPVYLDCNATTPIEPDVAEVVARYTVEEFGNAGSRTHEFGLRAQRAVEKAREQVAAVVEAESSEVLFTSGATESNNLAILGLQKEAKRTGKQHVISTAIEHKAVLEPLAYLEEEGFEVDLVPPNRGGWVDPEDVAGRLREDTLLVSVMHVNNETGVIQPLCEIAELLVDHEAYLHTDAAQGFGKELDALRSPRIDLISVSGHKIYGPKGVGALITRRRSGNLPPLAPLVFGGGQERGIRPGTLPVALVAGLGAAAEIALEKSGDRRAKNETFREALLEALDPLEVRLHGDPERCTPTTLSFSVPGMDSEAVMLALGDYVAVSNGSACTSTSYEPSHVMLAMGLSGGEAEEVLRWSWCHRTPAPDLPSICSLLQLLR